jgi:hypothetical protein
MPLKRAAAFTLMEMLVIISIITLLLSLSSPSLRQSRMHSRAVKCAAQIAQLAWAVTQYTDQHHGRMFPFLHLPNKYWIGQLRPYWGKDPNLLLCPEADTPNTPPGLGDATHAWGPLGDWGDGMSGSYGMNLWLLSTGDYTNILPSTGYIRHIDQATADTPAFGDSQWVGSWPNDQDTLPTNLQKPPNDHAFGFFMSRFCVDRHIMRINVSFMDRSARAVAIRDLWKLKWHRTFKPGNPL